ncbi:MAG: class I SAM-dependent methyltransferase [Planctomycetota bacterium]
MNQIKSDMVEKNRQIWDRMALAGDKFYRAVSSEEIHAACQGQMRIRVTPTKPLPDDWIGNVKGQNLLCLAGAGGRQAPLLAAAGASVTVFDISENQLDRDRAIAVKEQLNLTAVRGDMRDLSQLQDGQFDVIVSPCATCFCPSVNEIWKEAFRVLKPGGALIIGFINPVYYLFDSVALDQNQFKVRHSIPYSDFDLPEEERERIFGDSRPIEFGHPLSDLIGDQCEAGFQLAGFFEDGWGGNDKLSSMISLFIATRSIKPD